MRPARLLVALLAPGAVFAQEPAPAEAPAGMPPAAPEQPPPAASYAPDAQRASSLQVAGYLDLGFARAQGDGTSFPHDVDLFPIDYAVDTFATAVNSRGDVASTDSDHVFTNGFLPRSMGLGGRPGAFVSTVSLDLRYEPAGAPLLFFARAQLLPRLTADNLEETRLVLDQAFVRWIPLDSREWAVTVGKFDPVFGIEYLDNEAPLRTGVTPSLVARYTTGRQLGVKSFYRHQLPSLHSALSINAAVTNNPPLYDTLAPSSASLGGTPFLSARLGCELNARRFQAKAGLSGGRGARGDQTQPADGLFDGAPGVTHVQWGADLRLLAGPFALSSEYVRVIEDEGGADKIGPARLVNAFDVQGVSVQAAWGWSVEAGPLRKLTPYARWDRRWGGFTSFVFLNTERRTAGLRADLWDGLALKAEYLWNLEIGGAPDVANDVFTSSLVAWF